MGQGPFRRVVIVIREACAPTRMTMRWRTGLPRSAVGLCLSLAAVPTG